MTVAAIAGFTHYAQADCDQSTPCSEETNTGSGKAYSGTTTGSIALYGADTAGGWGVWGQSSSGVGVYGQSSGSNVGVYGYSTGYYGVAGSSAGAQGGYFESTSSSSDALWGTTASTYTGVVGNNTHSGSCNSNQCVGVYGISSNGTGVYGKSLSSSGYAGYFYGNVEITGNLTVLGSCSGCSDLRLKKNVKPLESALDELLKLKGVTFEWIDPKAHGNDSATQRGFIAQDVEKVFPNWVKADGYTAPDGQKYRTLELRQIEALEVESIRILKESNDALKEQVATLEERLASLENARPHAGLNLNGLGLGAGGLALAGVLLATRRKRTPSA